MKRKSTRFIVASAMLTIVFGASFTSCKDDDEKVLIGNWVEQRAFCPLINRGAAVCFQIGQTAYIGTGVNTSRAEDGCYFSDFTSVTPFGSNGITWSDGWEYNGDKGVSSMPDAAGQRFGAVAFALKGKGYVGLGYNGSNCLCDFWEFDPNGTPSADQYDLGEEYKTSHPTYVSTLDKMREEARAKVGSAATGRWRRIADYPGDSCRYAVAFVVHSNKSGKDYAYVGTGEDCDLKTMNKFYRFDGEKWEPAPACNTNRTKATTFVMNIDGVDYAYLLGGVTSIGATYALERFNADTETWEKHSVNGDTTLLTIAATTSFVLPDRQKAYVATGGASYVGNIVCEYDPTEEQWTQKTYFEGYQRCFANSFVLQQPDRETGELRYVPYLCLGSASSSLNSSHSGGTFYDDVWSFEPSQGYDKYDYN
ncbi:MAG: hypothetical protein K6G73_08475 [Marinilabiliaceae bacterium]|nr:hypothetical protein [Marinilabiliaceae bacterium]